MTVYLLSTCPRCFTYLTGGELVCPDCSQNLDTDNEGNTTALPDPIFQGEGRGAQEVTS